MIPADEATKLHRLVCRPCKLALRDQLLKIAYRMNHNSEALL